MNSKTTNVRSLLACTGLMLSIGATANAGPGVFIGNGQSALPDVRSIATMPGTASSRGQISNAYPASFQGGVRVAAGDVTGDGVDDIITGAGPGAGPHVRVFDGKTGQERLSFFAFDPAFASGVHVAAGDVDGDGIEDVVVGSGAGGGHVKVFDGATGAERLSFFAFSGQAAGVTVAAGDLDGDGQAEIMCGTTSGAGPHVKVFDGVTGAERSSFFAFPANFQGGVFVAAGDVDGDGRAEIVAGAGPGAGPHVKVFDGVTGAERSSLFAYSAGFQGGVRVAVGDVNGDGRAEIITGAGAGDLGNEPNVRAFDGRGHHASIWNFHVWNAAYNPGVYVAVGNLPPAPCAGDASLDGKVDFSDVSSVLGNFGLTCP